MNGSRLTTPNRILPLSAATALLFAAALWLLAYSAPAPASTKAPPRTAARGSAAKVHIRGFKFQPGKIHVRRGTKVVFSNSSNVAHTATRRGSFDTGVIRPGRAAAVVFRRPGTYAYHCTIHPYMHGKIVVG
jgi:plastocyanin